MIMSTFLLLLVSRNGAAGAPPKERLSLLLPPKIPVEILDFAPMDSAAGIDSRFPSGENQMGLIRWSQEKVRHLSIFVLC